MEYFFLPKIQVLLWLGIFGTIQPSNPTVEKLSVLESIKFFYFSKGYIGNFSPMAPPV
jgi:hypothetical protein